MARDSRGSFIAPPYRRQRRRRPLITLLLSSAVIVVAALTETARLAAAPPPSSPQASMVRLLIPLETDLAMDKVADLAALAPQAQVIEVAGQPYVLVGSFADARAAYRLGRSLQQRLDLPFDLAYDPGHPQVSLAWLPETEGIARTVNQPQTLKSQTPPRADIRTTTVSRSAAVQPTARLSASALGRFETLGTAQPVASLPSATREEPVSRPATTPLAAIDVPPTLEAKAQPIGQEPDVHHAWVQPVSIAAVPVRVMTDPNLIAVNPKLVYLYVNLEKPSDAKAVQEITPVVALHQQKGQVLAQVGVYQPNPIGRRLLDAEMDRLASQGFSTQVISRTQEATVAQQPSSPDAVLSATTQPATALAPGLI